MLVFQRVGTIIDSAYSDVYIYILYTSLSYVCMYNMNIYIYIPMDPSTFTGSMSRVWFRGYFIPSRRSVWIHRIYVYIGVLGQKLVVGKNYNPYPENIMFLCREHLFLWQNYKLFISKNLSTVMPPSCKLVYKTHQLLICIYCLCIYIYHKPFLEL